MSLILQMKEANDKLFAENNALRAENKEMKEGIQQIVQSLKNVWTALDLEPGFFENKNKLLMLTKLASKTSKKGVMKALEEEWSKASLIIDKNKHLIQE